MMRDDIDHRTIDRIHPIPARLPDDARPDGVGSVSSAEPGPITFLIISRYQNALTINEAPVGQGYYEVMCLIEAGEYDTAVMVWQIEAGRQTDVSDIMAQAIAERAVYAGEVCGPARRFCEMYGRHVPAFEEPDPFGDAADYWRYRSAAE